MTIDPAGTLTTDDPTNHMKAALNLAQRGLGNVWPNPAVGCVIVQNGRVVGRGWTQPSGLPQQANVWALKSIGVERILSVSAVGSLREAYRPLDLVVPDQLIDRTHGQRPATFFGKGVIAHIAMADPFCPSLRLLVVEAADATDANVHDGGTYTVVEGPAFGTRAESHLYRSWGASVVGMTALPEAKLAREAEICYTTLASVTDYDSWHESEDAVTAETVFTVLKHNVEVSQEVVRRLVARLAESDPGQCDCTTSLDAALVTAPAAIPAAAAERLAPILTRVLGAGE